MIVQVNELREYENKKVDICIVSFALFVLKHSFMTVENHSILTGLL